MFSPRSKKRADDRRDEWRAAEVSTVSAPGDHTPAGPQRHTPARHTPRHTPAGPYRHTPAGPQRHTPAGPYRHTPAGPQRHTPAGPQRHTPAGPQRHTPAGSHRHSQALGGQHGARVKPARRPGRGAKQGQRAGSTWPGVSTSADRVTTLTAPPQLGAAPRPAGDPPCEATLTTSTARDRSADHLTVCGTEAATTSGTLSCCSCRYCQGLEDRVCIQQDTVSTHQDTVSTHQDTVSTHKDTGCTHLDTESTRQDTVSTHQDPVSTLPVSTRPGHTETGHQDSVRSSHQVCHPSSHIHNDCDTLDDNDGDDDDDDDESDGAEVSLRQRPARGDQAEGPAPTNPHCSASVAQVSFHPAPHTCDRHLLLPDSQPVGHRAPGPDSQPVGHRAPGPDSQPVGHRAPGPDNHSAGHRAPGPDSHSAGHRAPGPDNHSVGLRAPGPDNHSAGHRAPGPESQPVGHRAPGPDNHSAGHRAPGPDNHSAVHRAPGPDNHSAGHRAPGPDNHSAGHRAPGPDSSQVSADSVAWPEFQLLESRRGSSVTFILPAHVRDSRSSSPSPGTWDCVTDTSLSLQERYQDLYCRRMSAPELPPIADRERHRPPSRSTSKSSLNQLTAVVTNKNYYSRLTSGASLHRNHSDSSLKGLLLGSQVPTQSSGSLNSYPSGGGGLGGRGTPGLADGSLPPPHLHRCSSRALSWCATDNSAGSVPKLETLFERKNVPALNTNTPLNNIPPSSTSLSKNNETPPLQVKNNNNNNNSKSPNNNLIPPRSASVNGIRRSDSQELAKLRGRKKRLQSECGVGEVDTLTTVEHFGRLKLNGMRRSVSDNKLVDRKNVRNARLHSSRHLSVNKTDKLTHRKASRVVGASNLSLTKGMRRVSSVSAINNMVGTNRPRLNSLQDNENMEGVGEELDDSEEEEERTDRIREWLLGLDCADAPPEPVIDYADDPPQTDTALHIVYREDGQS